MHNVVVLCELCVRTCHRKCMSKFSEQQLNSVGLCAKSGICYHGCVIRVQFKLCKGDGGDVHVFLYVI